MVGFHSVTEVKCLATSFGNRALNIKFIMSQSYIVPLDAESLILVLNTAISGSNLDPPLLDARTDRVNNTSEPW